MIDFVFAFWVFLNVLLLIYICEELILVFAALRYKKPKSNLNLDNLPAVTLQLPLYNEPYVIERLLDACMKLDYPDSLFQIQILDDSNDKTTALIENYLAQKCTRKIEVQHIRRENRKGYKAGALDYGMSDAKGEFIVIFDADFIPQSDFLLKTIPHFSHEKVGVVQTKWGHTNETYSLLTRAQAIMLNTHFSVEQMGRSFKKAYINFNGTAGVWRKSCILDAGGWAADTLTEDLDLSYRAQIRNWEFVYLNDVETPAELPITFEAYKTQQFRWSKGAAECVKKNWNLLWTAQIPLKNKIFGSFHLLNSSIYFLVFLLLLTSPLIYYFAALDKIRFPFHEQLGIIGLIVSSLLVLVFAFGQFMGRKVTLAQILWFFPSLFIYFSMTAGISIYMAKGVFEGYRGKKTAFLRTPKLGTNRQYAIEKPQGNSLFSLTTFLEFAFLLYGLFYLFQGISKGKAEIVIYGAILAIGFSLSLFFPKISWKWKK